MSQLVLSPGNPKAVPNGLDLFLVPAACAVVSATVLSLRFIVSLGGIKRTFAKLSGRNSSEGRDHIDTSERALGQSSILDIRSHIQSYGSTLIFAWKLLRLLCCAALSVISIFAVRYAGNGGPQHHTGRFLDAKRAEVLLSLFYIYTSLLAALALMLQSPYRAIANYHLVALLLVLLGVYVWHDILPLTTYTLSPLDPIGDWLLWSRFGILAFTSVVLPLCIPRQYVPVDPKNPGTPSPEQTAPLISLITYSFLDALVWTTYCSSTGKLDYDLLPPLADRDNAAYLKERSFSKLDPLKRTKDRHLFWGFMSMYWREYCVMGVMAIIQAIADFSGPLGIRYLLKYIENPSQHGYVRPWVWVLLLFLGPITGSFAMQWFIFLSTRILVHIEAIITQLIFEHSLRIRMTGGVGGANVPNGGKATSTVNSESNTTQIQTPEGETNTPVEGEAANSSDSQTLAASTSSSKDPKQGKPEIAKGKGEDSNLLGKINNLMSTDLKNIAGGRSFMYVLVYSPAQIIGSVVFLYWVLGWSSVVGMALMVSTLPIPGKVAHLVNGVQVERMKKTDARVQSITETMSVIRMIKLFGWEKKIQSQVEEKRETELQWYRKSEILGLISSDVNHFIPTLVMILTFSSHTLLFKKPLTASAVFSSIAVFDILRNQLYFVFGEITAIIQAKVSLDRANDFLKNTELLDTYANQPSSTIEPSPPYPNAIGFRNATFTWAKQSPGVSSPSRRNFRLRIDREILFHRGKINMITGPTGCGKTSLLMALLGEMHFIPSGPDSWFSLPRERGVAYAAQEAWVQNETIRNNILLGAEYDEERYNQVISQCALEKDLALFEARDLTEVGVKRQVTVKEQLSEVITLTGVFQARVSLARAIYSTAEIVILDDVLSALDVHTSRWIVDQCFRGQLVAGRTMIIVTHNVAMVGEVADYVVSFGTDGRIISQGQVADVLRSNPRLRAEAEKDKELERKAADTVEVPEPVEEKAPGSEAKAPDGKLMMAEEIAVGHVGWPALKLFFISLGGFWFWIIYLGGFALADGTLILQGYWLGVWARAYETHPGNVDIQFYLAVYVLLCFGAVVAYTGGFLIHIFGSVRAARRIHHHLVVSVLGAPLRWIDSTPMGRVIARFTQDMQSVDGAIPKQLERLVNVTLSLIMCFAAVVIFSPRFTFVGVVILGVGLMIGQIYIASQLSVKREMSNARSPVFSHFGAALAGIVSIRAYGAEEYFRAEALRKIDSYSQSARSFYNLNRWICIRMDALGGLFAASLASYLTYLGTSVDASNTGFALNRAVALSGGIIWWVRFLNEFELQGNSLERIQHYIDLEQEPAPTPEKVPPAYWPSSGRIVVENLAARYHADGPAVLHGLSFEIKSGERVGIVGRTGSGKSSLMLSLLRMIPIEGDIYYDGIPTHAINLDALRSNITIIPQQPELISGTVRQNLDPFDEYDDAFLISALRSAGLDSIQSEGDESRIELDSCVSGGGSNFSLGQRQILALARAIVRKSKVLVLDEATAAIDYNIDNAIQNSIRTELKDRTLIIVAHRLQTICDADKIMVLDAGKILEFDTPAALLRKEGGAFKSLVDESGDRDALYAMAKGQK